jgi:hypothetical protein
MAICKQPISQCTHHARLTKKEPGLHLAQFLGTSLSNSLFYWVTPQVTGKLPAIFPSSLQERILQKENGGGRAAPHSFWPSHLLTFVVSLFFFLMCLQKSF